MSSTLPGAACVGLPEDQRAWFFTEPEEGSLYKRAQKICQGCPVQQRCLDGALARNEEYGIWGGTTRRARVRMSQNLLAESA